MKRIDRSIEIFKRLNKFFPDAHCELYHKTPFQLLVATILSAQCTDVQVNKVTPKLFSQFPTAEALQMADLEVVEELIRSIGLYKTKAKNIILCAKKIVEQFQGSVPRNLDDLISLPGVGRKTANVVLGNAFNLSYGVVVDTHVKRISHRLGLTKHTDPEKIEKDLMKIFPQKHWTLLSHLFIFLGRRICLARRPQCANCPLSDQCPSISKTL